MRLAKCVGSIVMAIVAAAGCAQRIPPAMPVPAVAASIVCFKGSALTGPMDASPVAATAPTTRSAHDALQMRIAVYSRAAGVDASGETLGQLSRLVIADREGAPVLPSTRLTVDCRLIQGAPAVELARRLDGDPPSAAVKLMDDSAAIEPGATAAAALEFESLQSPARLTIAVSRKSHAEDEPTIELAVGLRQVVDVIDESSADSTDAANEDAPPPARKVLQRELALVPLAEGVDTIVLLLPIEIEGGNSVAAVVSLSPLRNSADELALLDRSRKMMAAAAASDSAGKPDAAAVAARAGIEQVLAATGDARRMRSSFLFAANSTGAPIAADTALAGDDALIAALTNRLSDQFKTMPADAPPAQWGLLLDLIALSTLADMQSNSKLPPALQAVLAIHTGEAGRHSGTIDELIKNVASRGELDLRMSAENFIYLEDNSPAARVRAFDWLSARGKAPPAYDPLGDSRSRRNALEQVLAASTQPSNP